MILRAENISRNFLRKRNGSNVFTAVSETSITLEPGKLTVISGHSGSGKSTLMNMLSGLLSPTTGKVYYGDCDLYSLSDAELSLLRNREFGLVPQGQTAIGSLTVLENIMAPYLIHGKAALKEEGFAGALEYALTLLKLVGIEDLKDVMPKELSGGEVRRMAIARALIRKPAVLFADEPTGDLDHENTVIIMELFKKLAAEGTAVLVVSHDKEALDYADIHYEMDGGKASLV